MLKLSIKRSASKKQISASALGFANCRIKITVMNYLTPFMNKLKYVAKEKLKDFKFIYFLQ
jgi:hypothetical protein